MLHQDLKLNPNLLYLAKRILLAKNLWGCKKQEKDKTTYWIGIRVIIAHLQKPLRPGWWMLWTLVKVSFKTMLKWAIRHQSRPLTARPLCTSCTPAHINSSNETEGTPQDRNSSSSVLTGDLGSHFQCFYQLPVILTLSLAAQWRPVERQWVHVGTTMTLLMQSQQEHEGCQEEKHWVPQSIAVTHSSCMLNWSKDKVNCWLLWLY